MFGSLGNVFEIPDLCFFESKMTALAIYYVSSGFCLAADGRVMHTNGVPVVTDDYSQKIFTTQSPNFSLAYVTAGEVLSDDHTYDLQSETEKLTSNLSLENLLSFRDYRDAFGEGLKRTINKSKESGKISLYPNPSSPLDYGDRAKIIVEIFLLGYFCGSPVWSEFSFSHEGNRVSLDINTKVLHPGKTYAAGSNLVPRLAIDGDVRLEKYYHQLNQKPSSLDDAANYVTAFVEACCDPCAKEIDPQWCNMIGGHVHVAEVTPAGFRWRIPPKKLATRVKSLSRHRLVSQPQKGLYSSG